MVELIFILAVEVPLTEVVSLASVAFIAKGDKCKIYLAELAASLSSTTWKFSTGSAHFV